MKSKTFNYFFAVAFLQMLSANYAHPITPTLLVDLQMPEYMFGVAFAGMAFTNFLFSPFWGKMRDFFPARVLLLVGCWGYSAGQYLFGIASDEISIIIARSIAGFFVGAIGVSTLIYLTEQSKPEDIGTNLAKLTMFQTLGGSLGYFIGGVIGIYSIPMTFITQSLSLLLCGVLYYIWLEDSVRTEKNITKKGLLREINPLKSFWDCRVFLNMGLVLLLAVIVLVTIATNAFDQSFNYYLKAGFHFPSTYNGTLKAVTGVVTLLVVGTICMRLLKSGFQIQSSILLLLFSGLNILWIMNTHIVLLFLAQAVLFYSVNTMIYPLLQDTMVKEGGAGNRNLLMGLYNAVRSLGMILGALFAGFLYGIKVELPFYLASVGFMLSATIMLVFWLYSGRRAERQ